MRPAPILIDDAMALRILHMREHENLTCREIGERVGRSRNAIIGFLNRINRDTDKHDRTPHLNGSMPAQWYLAGLRVSGRSAT